MTNERHKYGPFEKNENNYYRVCLKCGKKSLYPLDIDIDKEYDKQRVTNYMIDIIMNKDVATIIDEDYFLKLVASLFDNISYIYLDNKKQGRLIRSLCELNEYYNKDNDVRYDLISDTAIYFKDFFDNYNNEIKDIYDDDLCDVLDERYSVINDRYDSEIYIILLREDNVIVKIDDNIDEDEEDNSLFESIEVGNAIKRMH